MIPNWLENVLIFSFSLLMVALAVWMVLSTINEALETEAKLEGKRAKKEAEALDNWKEAYEAEHTEHINDVADLSNEILTLKREIEVKNMVLSKVKVP